jgi:uncharacterized protein (DUF885 family)
MAAPSNITTEGLFRYYFGNLDDAVRVLHHHQIGNPRQRAQRGWFTYSKDLSSVVAHLKRHDQYFAERTLIYVPLERLNQNAVLQDLADAGTTAATIFNDLGGVARDAINRFIRQDYTLPR